MSTDFRDKEYKELQQITRGDGPDKWVAWNKDNTEISVVHTSNPHGLLSYGWDGSDKIILFCELKHEQNEMCPDWACKERLHIMWVLATRLADYLNNNNVKPNEENTSSLVKQWSLKD